MKHFEEPSFFKEHFFIMILYDNPIASTLTWTESKGSQVIYTFSQNSTFSFSFLREYYKLSCEYKI